ncbi:MAG: PD-(D/E)XK nuclease family protein [Clostridiales bacterium]|nr:PD-(D/E)XK nuclease family protein [Clostridiales bacterium]
MRYLTFDSFPTALERLAATLRIRKFDCDEYHIVLTPDRYTLAVENALFAGGGAIDCEALTLSRLTRRVVGEGKPLSREAGVMLTARAVSNVPLTYYARAARYGDFAREAYETLLQIESSGANAEDIKADGITAQKLTDLANIKREYAALKAEFSDPPDRLKDLIAAAGKSELIKKSHFYAIGYKNATKLNRDVFDAIAKHARSFDFYDAEPPVPRDTLTVYEAPDAIAEYKAVATDIKNYIYTGGGRTHYGDVSVICPEPRALERILNEYGIPFYSDVQTALFDTPPLAALYALYQMRKAGRSEFKTLVGLAKNPYSGVGGEDAERLEIRLAELGVDYDAENAEPRDERAYRALERVRAVLKVFRSKDKFKDACDAVMDYCDFDSVFARVSDGKDTDQIRPITRLLDLVESYGTGAFDGDAEAFFSAARASEVKSLPRRRDRVSVCMPQSLRMTRCKKLYIVDFNEGVLPATTADNGLLSDAELIATGNVVEPTARDINRRDREELAAVVSNAADVFIAYSCGGGARRAAFISELTRDEKGVRERSYVGDMTLLRESDDARFIARFACTPSAAREIAARRLSVHYGSVAAAVGPCENRAKPFSPHAEVTRKTLSVSELTHWFCCPYKRFLTDSVGLKERRDKRSAADFGLVMHEFMRRWIKLKPLDASRATVEKIVLSVLDDAGYLTSASARIERERLIRDACDFAAVNKRVIEAGEYAPELTEKPFGGEVMLGKNGDVKFVGVIDRVDVCGDDARVIDYKTGNKKFDLKKCREGLDMQLPLYAATLADKNVTGVFYLPIGPMYDGEGAALSGCMVKDERKALDYDRGMVNGERSEIIPARLKVSDGVPDGFNRPSAMLMEDSDFGALIDECVDIASVAADEINSGYIERTPTEDACDVCAYRALCFDKKPREAGDGEDGE